MPVQEWQMATEAWAQLIGEWQISSLQGAAIQVCYQLDENPYEQVSPDTVRWQVQAAEMLKLKVMADALRSFGLTL